MDTKNKPYIETLDELRIDQIRFKLQQFRYHITVEVTLHDKKIFKIEDNMILPEEQRTREGVLIVVKPEHYYIIKRTIIGETQKRADALNMPAAEPASMLTDAALIKRFTRKFISSIESYSALSDQVLVIREEYKAKVIEHCFSG